MTGAIHLGAAASRVLTPLSELLDRRAGYLVGGFVRDALLGRPDADLDLAVDTDAPALARTLADRLGGHYVLLDAEREVARAVFGEGFIVDIAPLRGGDIRADLALRDFTIDAMAIPLDAPSELIDPFGGAQDIEGHLVRVVSERALVDDPLRMLRAVRLASQLGFEIDPATADAIRSRTGLIVQSAAERQRDELARCFSTDASARAVRLMDGLGLLEPLFPEVTAGRGVEQPRDYHYYDVFDHNVEAVGALDIMLAEVEPPDARDAAFHQALWQTLGAAAGDAVREYLRVEASEGRSRRALLKIAGLLHDVAKPETRAPDANGRIRFFGHSEIGAETARVILTRLRFSRREIDLVATMVEEHLRPAQLGGVEPTRRALFRFFRDTGEAAEGILLLSLADAWASRGPTMDLDRWRAHVAYVAGILSRRHEDATIARPQRLLSGRDMMIEFGLKPGPEIGRLLAALEEAQGAGEVTTRQEALSFVRRIEREPERTPATGVQE